MAKPKILPLKFAKDLVTRGKHRLSRSNCLTTIAIDSVRSTFHFYSIVGNDRSTITHHIKNYKGGLFDEEFFKKFKEAVKEFAADNPAGGIRKVTVVIPDTAVLLDTVKLPTMRGPGQAKKNLQVTLGGLYQNYNDLRILSYEAERNRQYTTFAITAIQRYIVSSIYAACSENGMLVDKLTFASNAAVSGALALHPKLKGSSYLFLDIKDTCARYAFVTDGKVTGTYTLPFGLEFLKKAKLKGEDMLFDHSYAELTVLNAREKAKSKKLTVMALDESFSLSMEEPEEEDEETEVLSEEQLAEQAAAETEELEETEEEEAPTPARGAPKLFVRKSPRKLPKFMQREHPETEEGILYENFRIFVKWALTLLSGNERLTELDAPAFVCVNLPEELAGVLDRVNEELEENGILFIRLPYAAADAAIAANLELFGGFFPKQLTDNGF